MNTKELLFTLTKEAGVSGSEADVMKCAKELLDRFENIKIIEDKKNVVAVINEPKNNQPHILLDAHLDAIGLIVTGVEKGGFLRVAGCGGVDQKMLCAQEVTIHGKKGLYGIVSSTPPHLSTAENKNKIPDMNELLIDTGMDEAQAKEMIPLGSRISFKALPIELLNNRISSKSLDNRAGIATILLCLEKLRESEYDCGLTVMFSKQEETNGAGARVGAFALDVSESIVVDVSFGYTEDSPKHKCGKLGSGPMIGISPVLAKNIGDRLAEIAEKNKIPHQTEVMGGITSTNADYISVAKTGIPTGLLSIPLRYMHTPVELIDTEDIENAAGLLADYIMEAGASYAE